MIQAIRISIILCYYLFAVAVTWSRVEGAIAAKNGKQDTNEF